MVYPTNSNAAWPDFDGFFGIKEEFICDFYIVQINGTGIEARLTTNTGTYTINPDQLSEVTVNEWHHYALVYDGSELLLYLNGELDGSIAASGQILLDNLNLTFGKLVFGTNDFYLDGKLDEITIWSKALTQEEVLEYQCITGDPASIDSLVGYWDFNEEDGLVLPDLLENYDGVLTNMAGDEWLESEVCESGYTITFEVSDELTALPIEGADVNLEGLVKTTNIDGVTTFNNYDPGTYAYEVTSTDYYETSGEVTVVDTSITETVSLAPVLYYSITFVVTEDPGGSPIDSAIVNLNGTLKYTDETGTVVYEGFLPGTYTYNVSKEGYILSPGTVEITDDNVLLEIGLQPLATYSILFQVTEDPGSVPIDSALVDLEGVMMYTDESGTALYENYGTGTYNYSVSKPGFFNTEGTVEVEEEDVSVEIVLLIDGVAPHPGLEVSVSPNPADNYLNIRLNGLEITEGQAILSNMSGIPIQEVRLENAETTLRIQDQAAGIYLLRIVCNEWNVSKLVIIR